MRNRKFIMSSITLKGNTKSGIVINIDDTVSILEVLSDLKRKLNKSSNFFVGADVSLNIGRRVLFPIEEKTINELFNEYSISIKEIIREEEKVEEADSQKDVSQKEENPQVEQSEILEQPEQKVEVTTGIQTLFERRTIRSGQTLEFDGNIVLLGDVNSGAFISASGSVVVLGHLRGVVHSGCKGDESAIVIAVSLEPSQLRIANLVARSPDEDISNSSIKQPEKAYIKDGEIVVEPLIKVKRVNI